MKNVSICHLWTSATLIAIIPVQPCVAVRSVTEIVVVPDEVFIVPKMFDRCLPCNVSDNFFQRYGVIHYSAATISDSDERRTM